MREYADRISYVHIKDAKKVFGVEKSMLGRSGGERVRYYWELGVGKIDLEAVGRLLKKIKYDGWIVVECDGSENPSESTKINKNFIEEKLKPILL
jgi:inosose dehydratase